MHTSKKLQGNFVNMAGKTVRLQGMQVREPTIQALISLELAVSPYRQKPSKELRNIPNSYVRYYSLKQILFL